MHVPYSPVTRRRMVGVLVTVTALAALSGLGCRSARGFEVADCFRASPRQHPYRAGNRYLPVAAELKAKLYEIPTRQLRMITTAGAPVDLMLHHGGAYRVRERARLEGRVRDGAVLVLLDSHADLTDQVGLAPRPSTVDEADRIEYDIASHVVPSLADGLVSEVIHVANRRLDRQGRLPAHLPGTRLAWVAIFRDPKGVEAAVLLDGARPDRHDALARARPLLERRGRFVEGLVFTGTGRAAVTVRTIFLEDLPDFAGDKRPTILDIDADYFVLGPTGTVLTDRERAEIGRDAATVLARLWERGARPTVISVALSPGYTPEDRMAHVLAELLTSLEQVGFARFERRSDGTLAVESHSQPAATLPELRAARAAVLGAGQDPKRIADALAACQAVIDLHRATARAQQRQGWGNSPFVNTGNPGWWWQPSPVVIARRELNAVAEAHALRAQLFVAQGRSTDALSERSALRRDYSDAYLPVVIREYRPGYGWLVAEGWRHVGS